MFRGALRLAAGLSATAALAMLASAGAAQAAGQSLHYKLAGASAQAAWQHGSTLTFVDAELEGDSGAYLVYDRFRPTFSHGHFAGGIDVSGDTSRNVTVTVDRHLDSAFVEADVNARRCTVDRNGNASHCKRIGKIHLELAFTGIGRLSHDGSNDRFHEPGITITDHEVGTTREATVSGLIAGRRMRPTDLQFAQIGRLRGGGVIICHGGC